jgi:hypothetical protein
MSKYEVSLRGTVCVVTSRTNAAVSFIIMTADPSQKIRDRQGTGSPAIQGRPPLLPVTA